ncbi:MAG TPA: shikimate kinase [Candidatus Limnocylindria bacterium]|nr:shikimate kinase [Candidatus Limnocylindria bacterium]
MTTDPPMSPMAPMAPTPPVPPTRVVLLGMMGSGKSSVGRALSALTGWPFVDNDELVQAATGRTARELLAERGEAAMREAEAAALRRGLAADPPAIVATAAGTVLDPENRRRIDEGGFVVWLTAAPEVLARRAAGAAHRPWLDEDPEAWFAATAAERNPLYAAISDLVIDTGAIRPDEAARRIVEALSAGG